MPRSSTKAWGTLGLLLLLGACTATEHPPMTAESYASFRTALRGDAALRRDQTAACIAEGSAMPQAHREGLAQVLNAPIGDAVRVYCESLTNAIALEMVSYEDFVAIKTGGAEPAAALRILEAVRRVPATRLTAEEFIALRAALAGDDAFRDAQTQACMGELERLWTPAERAGFAGDLRVDPQRVVHTYCARLQSAIASGRLAYDDWLGLIDMDRHPIARERAMQVLRDEADGLHAFSGVIPSNQLP